jgi:hypothetical protein
MLFSKQVDIWSAKNWIKIIIPLCYLTGKKLLVDFLKSLVIYLC